MTKRDFLHNGGLDFTVEKVPVHTYDVLHADDYNKTPFFATVNVNSGEAWGTVKSKYTVKQNHELLDYILEKIGDGNYDLSESKCGHFNHGRKVYFYIKTTYTADWGQEQADTFVYGLSSHDGSQKLVFGVCNKIHSCSNMFGVLMNDKDKAHIVKHTKAISSIEGSNTLEDMINSNIRGISNLMKTMQRHQITYDNSIVSDVMDIVANSKGKVLRTPYYTRRNLVEDSVRAEMNTKGNTYYGLFNGMTHYITHNMESNDNIMNSIVGKGSEISKKVVQKIVKHMKENGCLN